MKKLIAKIGLFVIINLIINSIFIGITFAEDTTTSAKAPDSVEAILKKIGEPLKSLTECIDLKNEKDNSDSEYLITIVEEPLSLNATGDPGDEYQTRICYRNTFIIWVNKKKYTQSKLATECSDKAQDLANNGGEFKPQFTCSPVQVILSKGGASQIEGFIKQIYTFAASIVGIIAVAVIILSGIQISLGGGDSEGLTQAKDRIIKSLTGIAILFLSGLILYTINPTFFVK